ncbi:response regulator transcription factor [Acinetobacter baumannii]|uniref:response regulator transcription factor n=1 Tax=Acinetobacter baumannii TaxID=470 RepID=UPI00389290BA
MEYLHWNQFVDNFISSINKLVPFQSFFAYCVDNSQKYTFHEYYSRNLREKAIQHYIHAMSQYDPLCLLNHHSHRQNIHLLRTQEIPENYQFFLNENNVLDNIELSFQSTTQNLLGISLIRHANENVFSPQEIQIIETCYHLTQLNTQDYFNKQNMTSYLPNHITQNLTRSEKQVLNLILTGKKNQEIADELFVSIATVKTHLHHIFQKTMVKNKRELIIKSLSPS